MNLRKILHGDTTPLAIAGNEDGRYCVANGWTLDSYRRAQLAYETFAHSYIGPSGLARQPWSSLDYAEQRAWRNATNAIVRDVAPVRNRDD